MSGQAEPGSPKVRSNLQLRVMSAVVLAAVALGATWAGGVWFRLLAIAIGAAMLYEWLAMAGERASMRHKAGTAILAAIPLAMVLAGLSAAVVFSAIAAGALLTFGIAILGKERGGLGFALLYATAPVAALAFLRGSDQPGLAAMLFLFAVVWATDIMAYFVGRAVGGPKLAPAISPGKTISGAVGGAAFGMLAGVALGAAFGQGPGLLATAAIALCLSAVSQAGDLLESAVKRRFGAKDSGNLIPGHGGVMDRVDALVAAGAALYLFGAAAGFPDLPALALFGH